MATWSVKNHDAPDETRPLVDKGAVDIVSLPGGTIGRATFHPGWRWSEHVKPIAGTDSCQSHHLGYALSGLMRVRMDDGTEFDVRPGDVFEIGPGHDAWIVGDETHVSIDFAGMATYAKPR